MASGLRRWRPSIRLRAAVLAALVTALAFGGGALWQRHSLYQSRLDAAVAQASVDAHAIVADYVAGTPGRYRAAIPSWVVTLDDSAVLDAQGDLSRYIQGEPDIVQSAPVVTHDRGVLVVTADLTRFTGVGPLDGRQVYLAVARSPGPVTVRLFTSGRLAVPAGTGQLAPGESVPATGVVTAYTLAPPFDAEAAVAAVDRTLVAGLPLAALLVGCLVWVIAGRVLRPVAAIQAELADITARELDRRVPVPAATDELGRLARTTNATLDRLQQAVERQHRFVADAAHELRSPLAGLRNRLEIAVAHPDHASWTEAAAGALRSAKRLQQLTDDLLLLARADGPVGPDRQPVDLGALAAEKVAEREYLSPDGPRFTADVPPDPVEVPGDESQLGRLLRNLLDNAARHAETAVTVTVRTSPAAVTVEVTDDGPGIPAADRDRVFDRFTRLDAARSRDHGGTGLGLAIVAEIAARHGGDAHVADSERGARFVVRLPTATPAADPAPDPAARAAGAPAPAPAW